VSICPVVTDDPSYVFLEDYRHRPFFVASNCLLQIGKCPGSFVAHSTAHMYHRVLTPNCCFCRSKGFFLYFSGTRGNTIALDAMGGPSLMHYRLVGDFPQCEDLRYQVRVGEASNRANLKRIRPL